MVQTNLNTLKINELFGKNNINQEVKSFFLIKALLSKQINDEFCTLYAITQTNSTMQLIALKLQVGMTAFRFCHLGVNDFDDVLNYAQQNLVMVHSINHITKKVRS